MSQPTLRQEDAKHIRLKHILAELEEELAHIPADTFHAANLKHDFATLKHHLEAPEVEASVLRAHLGKTRNTAQKLMDSVEGEIFKDSPYVAELGRILGLI